MYSNLIWGFWGENILGDLAKDLQDRKANTICVDPTEDGIPYTKGLQINLLVSNHFTRTLNDLNDIYPEVKIKHDYYELVQNVNPVNSFFFIHDHSELLVLDEPMSIKSFAAVISPWPGIHKNIKSKNLFCCDIAFRNLDDFERHAINRKAVWFVSHIKYNVLKYGVRGFADLILETIDGCEISIKLPEYGVNTSLIEKILVENGVDVLPSSLSSARVAIESEIVVSSFSSGVSSLAQYYNKDCVIIKGPESSYFRQPNKIPSCNAPLLGNPLIVNNNKELKDALGRAIVSTPSKHRCGIFRDDFINEYHHKLF